MITGNTKGNAITLMIVVPPLSIPDSAAINVNIHYKPKAPNKAP